MPAQKPAWGNKNKPPKKTVYSAAQKAKIRQDNKKYKQHEKELQEYLWEYNDNNPKNAPDNYKMSSPLVHWELEKKYQETLRNGEKLPHTTKASELRQLNPSMPEFMYSYTITHDLRPNDRGGIVGYQTNLTTQRVREMRRWKSWRFAGQYKEDPYKGVRNDELLQGIQYIELSDDDGGNSSDY